MISRDLVAGVLGHVSKHEHGLSRCLCLHAEGECAYPILHIWSRPKHLGWINMRHGLSSANVRTCDKRSGGAKGLNRWSTWPRPFARRRVRSIEPARSRSHPKRMGAGGRHTTREGGQTAPVLKRD